MEIIKVINLIEKLDYVREVQPDGTVFLEVKLEDLKQMIQKDRRATVSLLSSWLEHDITCATQVNEKDKCDCYLESCVTDLENS